MRVLPALLLSACFAVAAMLPASAEVKGPNGEKCASVELKVKHPIKGKPYICNKCSFYQCDTKTKQISGCAAVTHWADCEEDVAAAPPPKKPDAPPAKPPAQSPAKKPGAPAKT